MEFRSEANVAIGYRLERNRIESQHQPRATRQARGFHTYKETHMNMKRFATRLFSGALLLVSLAAPGWAGVQPMPPTTLCEYYSRIAEMAAALRDQGVPSHAILTHFRTQLDATPDRPGVTTTGRNVVDGMITTIVVNVYAYPTVPPAQLKLVTYNVCLTTR